MSDSENIYSIPLDQENQIQTRSNEKVKPSVDGFSKSETEDENIPSLEYLQEKYYQELHFYLSHSFSKSSNVPFSFSIMIHFIRKFMD